MVTFGKITSFAPYINRGNNNILWAKGTFPGMGEVALNIHPDSDNKDELMISAYSIDESEAPKTLKAWDGTVSIKPLENLVRNLRIWGIKSIKSLTEDDQDVIMSTNFFPETHPEAPEGAGYEVKTQSMISGFTYEPNFLERAEHPNLFSEAQQDAETMKAQWLSMASKRLYTHPNHAPARHIEWAQWFNHLE